MFLSLLQTRCYHFGHWEWKRLQLAQRDCVLSRLTAQKFSGMPSTAASLTSSVTGLRAYATSVFVPPSCAAKSLSCPQKSNRGWCICAEERATSLAELLKTVCLLALLHNDKALEQPNMNRTTPTNINRALPTNINRAPPTNINRAPPTNIN